MDSENANLNVGGSEEGLNESFNKSGLTDWAD